MAPLQKIKEVGLNGFWTLMHKLLLLLQVPILAYFIWVTKSIIELEKDQALHNASLSHLGTQTRLEKIESKFEETQKAIHRIEVMLVKEFKPSSNIR
jgi:hypothetical protein